MKKPLSITPATLALDANSVEYVLHKFASAAKRDFGQEAAEQMKITPQRIFKTIIFTDSIKFFVAVAPVDCEISAKKLAQVVGTKTVTPAKAEDAQRASGYVVGGISPFGQKNLHFTVLDSSAWNFDTIYVSGGRRGIEIEVSADAFSQVLGAIRAPISDRTFSN